MNLPDSHFLPAPLWLITVLHLVTLTLHLSAMNFMVGGLVVVLFGKFKDRWADTTVRTFVKLFPSGMAATVTFGVAPLLFVQLVYPKQIYSAAIVSGWFWLMIIAAVIISYYFLYAGSFTKNGSGSRIRVYLTLALVGLIYVSFVYSTVFSLAERPDLYKMLYAGNQAGTVINTDVGSWIFRWLHMLLGAVTVGSFFVGLIGRNNPPAFDVGKRFFLLSMVITMVFGLAYLFTFGELLVPYMRTPAVWWLLASIVLSLGSLHLFFKRSFVVSGLMLFVSLFGMVTNRHYVRLLHLEGQYDPSTYPINPQWSVFVIFLICFVIAIAVVWYMLKLYFGGREQPVA